ncbi:right-handed parallel beta-helix repeat-containing protein [Microvirga soli]|uniref:right-handed parallel beta-helix repeat-containing protein n=1 Tax=Microvirga soli TaxID=1854496 RepID=UPI00191E2D1B|nr:right-handed parallel beta-helix repeat-containing protein [Microvirga soli]
MDNPDPNKVPVKVTLGVGEWLVTADKNVPSKGAIELPSGVELTGSGDRETVIKLENDFNARINGIVRTKLETVDNVIVSNLVIDGNRENNDGHQAGFICGIKEDGTGRTQSNITIDNVEVMNCTAYGINPHEVTTNMVVKNSEAHHNGLDGFVADAVIGGSYSNNLSYSNDRHGFNIQNETKDLVLANNVAHDNGFGINPETGLVYGGAGITIQRGNIPPAGSATIPWVTDIQIIGGKYYGNNKEGILVKLADSVTIDGVDVYGNLRQGVRIEGSTNTVLKNSEIYNNSQELANEYDEVNIRLRNDYEDGNAQKLPKTYYSTGTQIIDNDIYSNGAIKARWGIREEPTNDDGGPTGTEATGNTISGMASGSISIPGQVNPVTGTIGDDTLTGTAGADEMKGFGGDDIYIVNHSGDVAVEAAGEGNDTIYASISHTLKANIENLVLTGVGAINGDGNTLDNILVGNSASNRLKGDVGNDTLDGGAGIDTLDGGDGNDIYYVDSSADIIIEKDHLGAGGIDSVFSTASYSLSVEVENLTLLGSTHINATGNTQNNILTGNSGNNIIDGDKGSDVMTGGLGDDTYYVDHTGDVVVEKPGEGIDRVNSHISYTLRDNLEHLTLLEPTIAGIGPAVVGTGNDLNNEIIGNSLANKLNGAGGDDTMRGGAGNDTLDGGVGNDTAVFSGNYASYTIAGLLANRTVAGTTEGTDTLLNIEVLKFADGMLVGDTWVPNPVAPPPSPAPVTPPPPPPPVATGNDVVPRDGTAFRNTLTGKDNIDDVMRGLGGDDTIRGRGGNDSLSGGADNDRVYGDGGDDKVSGDGGNDRVYGGSGNDRAYGGSGNDKVYGNAGHDRVYGGSGHDTVDGGSGNDWVYGDSGNDRVYGGTGDDVVNGGAGNDRLYGGAGNDAFMFNTRLGTASTDRKVNFDTVVDFNVKYDSFLLDNSVFKKLGSGTLSNPTELDKEFFVVGSKAKERDDHLIYNKKTGVLSYDADGSGSKEAVEFAQLSKNLKLTHKDFFVI